MEALLRRYYFFHINNLDARDNLGDVVSCVCTAQDASRDFKVRQACIVAQEINPVADFPSAATTYNEMYRGVY